MVDQDVRVPVQLQRAMAAEAEAAREARAKVEFFRARSSRMMDVELWMNKRL